MMSHISLAACRVVSVFNSAQLCNSTVASIRTHSQSLIFRQLHTVVSNRSLQHSDINRRCAMGGARGVSRLYRTAAGSAGSSVGRRLLRVVKYTAAGVTAFSLYTAGVLVWNHEISPRQPIMVLGGGASNPGNLQNIELHQFGSCPFCCKLRTYLDYMGFTYQIVEVDPVYKWRSHKEVKLPTLKLQEHGQQKQISLSESSFLISLLESYLIRKESGSAEDADCDLESVISYYPEVYDEKKKRNMRMNKYFLMYGTDENLVARREESEWREWVDGHLVHMISPNVYRSLPECVDTFKYFSVAGNWDYLYGGVIGAGVKYTEIYLGALAMFALGKMLKKKYSLKSDVRESLYDACNEWCRAVGNDRTFMGGESPNLADLSVYGALKSFEGCQAFHDVLSHTNIGKWYGNMKMQVILHRGYRMDN